MIPLSLGQIAEVAGGLVHGDAATMVTGAATIDSRSVELGGLFVAIDGERVDGHDYAAAALASGAAAVLCSRAVQEPCVVVDDPTRALGLLARFVLDQIDPAVVAITGSQGKTTVKDLLAHLLQTHGNTIATAGNYNNELGVPLTVLRADANTDYLVVEMGARGIGHIAQLCQIAAPTVAAVLNVGTAHLGEFGSPANIAIAKGELVECLPPDGIAVLCADDAQVTQMADRVPQGAKVLWFGERAEPSDGVRLLSVAVDSFGEPEITIAHCQIEAGLVASGGINGTGTNGTGLKCTESGGTEIRRTEKLGLVGAHNAINGTAARAIAVALGIGIDQGSLAGFVSPSEGRMQRQDRADGVVVIDDSYNANPESMRAAIRAVSQIGSPVPTARRVAVLGEMLELGDDSYREHIVVGQLAASLGYDLVLAVGAGAAGIAAGAGSNASLVTDSADALKRLRSWLKPGDIVLVKASRGAQLERVSLGLLEE